MKILGTLMMIRKQYWLFQICFTPAFNILNPVCRLLNAAQENNAKVSDAIENQLILLEESEEWIKEIIKKILDKHNVFSNEAIIAHVLDPKYRGAKLPVPLRERADDAIILQLDAQGQSSYLQYTQQVGRFATLKNDLSLEVYWKLAKSGHPSLAELAQEHTHVPASSASLERLFSNWGYVHDKVRNRLTIDKSEKLIYIYYSHRVTRSRK